MQKKLLTLDDLVKFCSDNKLYTFDSKESGYKLSVQVPATFERKEDDGQSSLLFAKIRCFHTGKNRNGSDVTEECAKNAMKNMAYKPILANFTVDANGDDDFTSHDMDIDDDGDIIYLEHQIGCFTADEPYFEEYDGRQFVIATAAIPREYTKAADIIERKNGTKVSIELSINSMSYSKQDKTLIIEDAEVSGLTCLGVDPDSKKAVEEGMKDARLDIADFSQEKNSVCFEQDENAIAIMQELKNTLDNYISAMENKNFGRKEEPGMEFEENVEVTDAVETEAEETFEEVTEVEEEVVEEAETEESSEEVIVTEAQSEESTEVAPSEEVESNVQMSVVCGDVTYAATTSLSDTLYGLTTLVNDTYVDDGTYYSVDAYDGGTVKSRYVIMVDIFTGRGYKQAYQDKDGVLSLKGDRVPVTSVWVTEGEKAELDKMRDNYAALESEVKKFHEEPEKLEILNSDEYASIEESEEFVALKAQDAHFDLSVDEVREKADTLLLNAAKAGAVNFVKTDAEKKPVSMKQLPINEKAKKSGRYGGLFSKN